MKDLQRLKSVSDYHKVANITPPDHPLISLVDYSTVRYGDEIEKLRWIQDYYTFGMKRNVPFKLFYGQQEYDFDEGLMTFVAPNQIISLASNPNITQKPSGWLLLIHPDFLWGTALAKQIAQYEYFGYSINEALFLSHKEEKMMIEIFQNIKAEYQSNLDKFSQKIILSQVELLLNFAERFYERQFITRKILNHQILDKLETALHTYFSKNDLFEEGPPTVQWVSKQMNLSANYLSSMLKSLTGQSTQQHIHAKLIEKAKHQLSATNFPISEIAYNLGFARPGSFTKLFRNKTQMSPLEFRKSFN